MGLKTELLKAGLPVYSCSVYAGITLTSKRLVELNGDTWGVKGPTETLDDIGSYSKFYPEGAKYVSWFHTELEAYQAALESAEKSILEYQEKKQKLIELIETEQQKQNI